ncbi:MAG: hypothetical protein JWP97_4182 [Labilithrix sp.]|nr:hypothetical protein [Labilithrix sp.]
MSKAFTREDEDAGFELPPPVARMSEARLTAYGARLVRERVTEMTGHPDHLPALERFRVLLDTAEIVDPAGAEHVALGARVHFGSDLGPERTVVIVTPEEVGVVPDAVSASSPLAQALIGAKVGDVMELELPKGVEELEVLSIEWPA